MIRSTKWLALGGLLATGLVMVVGCGKKGPPPRPPIEASAVVGKWIEVSESGAASPRLQWSPPKEHLRYLVLNEDQTFEYSVHTKSGDPAKKKGKAEGTWEIDTQENIIVFTTTKSTLKEGDEFYDGLPVSSLGVKEKNIKDKGLVEVLITTDQEESGATYVRAD